MNSVDEEALHFVAASFPSVWALELLLVLKREGAPCKRDALVGRLRASELVVAKAADALVAAGLASVDGDTAVYLPINRDVEILVDKAEQLYRSHPNAVRRAIIAASTGSASAFADAFKLRRDADD